MKPKKVLDDALKQGLALTFEDVSLLTGYAEVMPDSVDLTTYFSRHIKLKIPIVSAAMDTVTEKEMAIELAKLGGIGIIHKNLSPYNQAAQVEKVKNHLNGLIRNPVFAYEDETIEQILETKRKKAYPFQSFPIKNRESKLVGLLTAPDFEFNSDKTKLAGQVMNPGVVTAPEGTTIEQAYKIMQEKKVRALPLINKEMELVGMYVFSDVNRIMGGKAETHNIDERGQLRVGAAIGVLDDAFERLEKLVPKNLDVAVIDTAHADSLPVIETLKKIKKSYSGLDVVVGNISNKSSIAKLLDAGADGIKVGQGPGGICITRVIAGIGRPQLAAIYDCADAGVPICGDGGLRYSGDITKAIAAGADCVMMGTMLAGTEEAPGEIIQLRGETWKYYRGMGSLGAMKNKGAAERYLQAGKRQEDLIAEGVEARVLFKGKLKDVVNQCIGGLRQGMGYVGAASIQELKEKGDFERMTNAGKEESHPHDVVMIKEPRNYQSEQFGES